MHFFLFFMKICLENSLGSDRMHENKIYFFVIFCFLKGEINFKVLRFFLIYNFLKEMFQKKPGILILNLNLIV